MEVVCILIILWAVIGLVIMVKMSDLATFNPISYNLAGGPLWWGAVWLINRELRMWKKECNIVDNEPLLEMEVETYGLEQ